MISCTHADSLSCIHIHTHTGMLNVTSNYSSMATRITVSCNFFPSTAIISVVDFRFLLFGRCECVVATFYVRCKNKKFHIHTHKLSHICAFADLSSSTGEFCVASNGNEGNKTPLYIGGRRLMANDDNDKA